MFNSGSSVRTGRKALLVLVLVVTAILSGCELISEIS